MVAPVVAVFADRGARCQWQWAGGSVNGLGCAPAACGATRPAVAACVACGAGVCQARAAVGVALERVHGARMAPAKFTGVRTVRCLSCHPVAEAWPWRARHRCDWYVVGAGGVR